MESYNYCEVACEKHNEVNIFSSSFNLTVSGKTKVMNININKAIEMTIDGGNQYD